MTKPTNQSKPFWQRGIEEEAAEFEDARKAAMDAMTSPATSSETIGAKENTLQIDGGPVANCLEVSEIPEVTIAELQLKILVLKCELAARDLSDIKRKNGVE